MGQVKQEERINLIWSSLMSLRTRIVFSKRRKPRGQIQERMEGQGVEILATDFFKHFCQEEKWEKDRFSCSFEENLLLTNSFFLKGSTVPDRQEQFMNTIFTCYSSCKVFIFYKWKWFYSQDVTLSCLGHRPAWDRLQLCAHRGGKTTLHSQQAEALSPSWFLLSHKGILSTAQTQVQDAS